MARIFMVEEEAFDLIRNAIDRERTPKPPPSIADRFDEIRLLIDGMRQYVAALEQSDAPCGCVRSIRHSIDVLDNEIDLLEAGVNDKRP